ncbi:MAG: peptidoglycan-binding protein [Actinobacteria bacterium]|nr:peptidoglycan-binding protein [Actinomycetota bacterium]
MADGDVARLVEVADLPYRLGRHLNHDPASRRYPAATAAPRTVSWPHHGPPLDQGNTSSCTGNALVDWLMCDPSWRDGVALDESAALRLYARATALDPFPGTFTYPPPGGDDTGSDGLSVCAAGVEAGLLARYDHAFGLDHLLGALAMSPAMVGTAWHRNMFFPDNAGFIWPTGAIVGGHEWVVTGVNVETRVAEGLTSWGTWGRWGDSRFLVSFEALDELLRAQGDVTVPRVAAPPPPPPGPTRHPYPGPPGLRLRSPAMTGEGVRVLQRRYVELGAMTPAEVDGVFGPRCDRVTRDYQHGAKLRADGIVGPITWGRLFP